MEPAENESNEDSCRICQLSASETPFQPLIRPCHCAGSCGFVHEKCLNRWRSTSSRVYERCEICSFKYITMKRPKSLISFIEKYHLISIIITPLLYIAIILTCGMLISFICYSYCGLAPSNEKCNVFEMLPDLIHSNASNFTLIPTCENYLDFFADIIPNNQNIRNDSSASMSKLQYSTMEVIYDLFKHTICKTAFRAYCYDLFYVGLMVVTCGYYFCLPLCILFHHLEEDFGRVGVFIQIVFLFPSNWLWRIFSWIGCETLFGNDENKSDLRLYVLMGVVGTITLIYRKIGKYLHTLCSPEEEGMVIACNEIVLNIDEAIETNETPCYC